MLNVSSPDDRGTTERENPGEGASTPTSPSDRAPRIEAAIPSDLSTIDHYCADLQTVLRDELLTSSPSTEELHRGRCSFALNHQIPLNRKIFADVGLYETIICKGLISIVVPTDDEPSPHPIKFFL